MSNGPTAISVSEQKKIGLADFTADLFEPLIGQTLEFERPEIAGSVSEPARMTLLEVERSDQLPQMLREPFSLLLALKDQEPLGRGLHRLNLPDCEPAELFIARVTVPKYERKDPASMYYQAVFG
jgi:hypothetical protein